LGCETYAVDLNPVAHIIELCTLVYPQTYGKTLADEVERWGQWVIDQVRQEIGDLYPPIKVGEVAPETSEQMNLLAGPRQRQLGLAQELTPVAYLWTRAVKCPNPGCGAQVPLVRQTWLCKKTNKYVALKVIPNHTTKRVEFEVVEAKNAKELGFDPASGSSRGNSTCRHCGTTIDVKYIKKEGMAGRIYQQPMAIVCTTSGSQGKTYLAGSTLEHYVPDEADLKQRLEKLCEETGLTTPSEPLPDYGTLGFSVQPYGLVKWEDLFTTRQLLALMTFVKWVRKAHEAMVEQGYEDGLAKAISTYLANSVSRMADFGSTLCLFNYTGGRGVVHTFGRQALPMVWDFAESAPFNPLGANYNAGIKAVTATFPNCLSDKIGKVNRCSSVNLPLDNGTLDAVITDPPYFDSVPYADLSDFFYVWLKRSVGHLYPEHFSGQLTPKKKEAIMEPSRHGGDKKVAAKAYEDMMHQAFCEANRVLKAEGMMVVVYAHKTTAGWATLIDSLRRAGFTITEAWPLDTEKVGRLRAQNSAALASSIFLVARKGKRAGVGDYAIDVMPELKKITQERVATLMAEGVSGADLVNACIGAGLRAYTQYERVELPNGEELAASSFLDEVQKEVVEVVLTKVLQCDRRGVSAVDKPTQFYIMARYEYGEAIVEFDEANTLAKDIGVELDGPSGLTDGKHALVKKTTSKVQLNDYQDRGASDNLGLQKTEGRQTFEVDPALGPAPSLIDILHRLLWLSENNPGAVNPFLIQAQPDGTQLRLVAQALAGRALTPNHSRKDTPDPITTQRTREQAVIDTLLASWKRLVEDNLFTIKD
jgi:putative DNA methylase